MCGIAGRFNYLSGAPVSAELLGRMCDLIAHRGPDGDGVWTDGPWDSAIDGWRSST